MWGDEQQQECDKLCNAPRRNEWPSAWWEQQPRLEDNLLRLLRDFQSGSGMRVFRYADDVCVTSFEEGLASDTSVTFHPMSARCPQRAAADLRTSANERASALQTLADVDAVHKLFEWGNLWPLKRKGRHVWLALSCCSSSSFPCFYVKLERGDMQKKKRKIEKAGALLSQGAEASVQSEVSWRWSQKWFCCDFSSDIGFMRYSWPCSLWLLR